MGMANTIKKGESLFIPFKNGESIYDSQLKPRMYKTKEQYDRFSYHFKDAEMVEYAEVVHSLWCWITEDIYGCNNCGHTNHVKTVMGKPAWFYCPNCGARMEVYDWNG